MKVGRGQVEVNVRLTFYIRQSGFRPGSFLKVLTNLLYTVAVLQDRSETFVVSLMGMRWSRYVVRLAGSAVEPISGGEDVVSLLHPSHGVPQRSVIALVLSSTSGF